MKHHYIVYAWLKFDAVCRMGAVCAQEELRPYLLRKNVKGYKLISVDDEVVGEWDKQEWELL
jgi:non-ribosomal peptide synthetase component E (peptide arylation enzyme)